MEKYLYQDLYTLEDKHWWHISKRNSVKLLIKKYVKKSPSNSLDIGCGTGKNLEFLSSLGQASGIDSSEEALKFCRKRGFKNLKLGSSNKTGFSSASFDLVTLLDVLEHVEEKPTIREISRILKKNGFLIITVPAYSWLWSKWDEVLHHKRRYDKKRLQTLLEFNGFKIKKISYLYPHLILPVYLIRQIKRKQSFYESDFKINSLIFNNLLLLISNLQNLILNFFSIPFGTSLICIAKKK